ncbi:DUF1572 family protein [Paenibacillus sp. WLX2291]|uniref:DUF1572 family protein n=1 Tax=Paenibacillus sp. WLX2291 TaxID=3296934 RepID=UPI003983F397
MSQQPAILDSIIKQFMYYRTLGEKAMRQLEPEQWFVSPNEDSNSIAVIVKHLHGNMLSRWTDFLTSDGEKEWRNRDDEFEEDTADPEQVWQRWQQGWDCLIQTLEHMQPEQLEQIIYIRNEGHTALEAINRQLCHYPYHVGQIVYIAKMLKHGSWDSLSIPKRQSNDYNEKKFAAPPVRRHFTEEV